MPITYYRYQGKKGTLGKIISSESLEEIINIGVTEKIKEKKEKVDIYGNRDSDK